MGNNITSSFALFESRRIRLSQDIMGRIDALAARLWRMRGRRMQKVTWVDLWPFRTLDGTDALVQIYVDPHMEDTWGMAGTDPAYSRDPLDLELAMCHPRHFSGTNDIRNMLTHEMMHLMDPSETTRFTPKDHIGYNPWAGPEDDAYLGHKGEYTAIYNEVLGSIVSVFGRIAKTHSRKTRLGILDDLLAFFSSGELNEGRMPDRLVRFFERAATDRDFIDLIREIKRHRPNAHRVFLSKLYDTVEELRASV